MTTDIDCIQGKKTYDDVKDDADPFSRKLTSCYNKFPIGADKTYMK